LGGPESLLTQNPGRIIKIRNSVVKRTPVESKGRQQAKGPKLWTGSKAEKKSEPDLKG